MAVDTVVTQSVLIDAPPAIVFDVLVDPRSLEVRSRDTEVLAVETNGPLRAGSQYQRILRSHGLANRQLVTAIVVDAPHHFVTRTQLLGHTVEYDYEVTPIADARTQLTLTKRAGGGWRILKPLVAHLLTRPEHDADHVERIRELAETVARSSSQIGRAHV